MQKHATGAVRSDDAKDERWGLMSWAALRHLAVGMHGATLTDGPDAIALGNCVEEKLGLARKSMGFFLGTSDIEHLQYGWANLALAIHQSDLGPENYNAYVHRVVGRGDSLFMRPKERWDLIPQSALVRLATTLDEGAKKYGQHNWLFGFQVMSLAERVLRHLGMKLENDHSEDHLGHSMWGFMAVAHMFTFRPDMQKGLLTGRWELTDEIRAELNEHASRRALRPISETPAENVTVIRPAVQTRPRSVRKLGKASS